MPVPVDWKRLSAGLAAARRKRESSAAAASRISVPLRELRRMRRVSQVVLAKRLAMAQPGISRLEGQADMQLGTLRRYVRALGGRLELVARFPEGDVLISPPTD